MKITSPRLQTNLKSRLLKSTKREVTESKRKEVTENLETDLKDSKEKSLLLKVPLRRVLLKNNPSPKEKVRETEPPELTEREETEMVRKLDVKFAIYLYEKRSDIR